MYMYDENNQRKFVIYIYSNIEESHTLVLDPFYNEKHDIFTFFSRC
jgi:hypothetical protein